MTALMLQEIDELIEEFKSADDANFTLFTYAAELHTEVATLEERAKALERELVAAAAEDAAAAGDRAAAQTEVRLLHSMLS